MVAQGSLEAFVMVRIHVGQPLQFPQEFAFFIQRSFRPQEFILKIPRHTQHCALRINAEIVFRHAGVGDVLKTIFSIQ
jgi:hypothetical protein